MSTTPAKENGAAAVASNDGGVKTPNSVRARERTTTRDDDDDDDANGRF
jgi:hypothetical protein